MRLRLALVGAVLAAGVVGVVLISGGGDQGSSGAGSLVWQGDPLAIEPQRLPDDRVAVGRVRNSGLQEIDASVEDFEVRDADGSPLVANFQFIDTYAHSVYGAFQRPDPLPEDERLRLGFDLRLKAGQTSPLAVSYRLRPRSPMPAAVYYRGVRALDLPAG